MADDITNQQVLESISELLSDITDMMVTKDDLKRELANYSTKDDLKAFATKEDIKQFATKEDLQQTEARLSRKLDAHKQANIKHQLAVRVDIGELNRKFDNLRSGLAQAAKPI